MKKLLAGMTIAISTTGIVYADNTWTGFYTGANAGMLFNHTQLNSQQLGFTNTSNTCNLSSDYSSFSPGIQFGYLRQFSNAIVSGVEADVNYNANQKDTFTCSSNLNANVYDRFIFRNQMQSAIKGRVGRALTWYDRIILPYLTAGASFAKVGLTYKNEGGNYYSRNTTEPGWLLGAGIEWAFQQNWSVRAEYFYANYGDAITLNLPSVYGLQDPNGHAKVDLNSNNVVVSVNYWLS